MKADRYAHEDGLLKEWAHWTRFTPYCEGFTNCTLRPQGAVRQPRSDDEMLRIDRAVARLPIDQKKTIKKYYLQREIDINPRRIESSLQAFALSFSPGFHHREY